MNTKGEKAESEELTEDLAQTEIESESSEVHEFGEAEPLDPVLSIQKQLEDEKSKYLRLYAEFENFRKRNAKERIELIGSASSELIKALLPILDDFERAIESNKNINDVNAIKEGFVLLQQKLTNTLESKGLKRISSKGESFDAELHEAIAQIPAENTKMKGKIVDEVERGYTLNDKVIRHPKVVVGS